MVTRRRAFTLFELTVTLAVMSIVAVAGVGLGRSLVSRSDTISADLVLTQVVLAQQEAAVGLGSFTPAPEDLTALPRSVSVVSTASTTRGQVSMSVGDGGTLVVATVTPAGACRYRVVPAPVTGSATTSGEAALGPACRAAAFLPAGEDPLPATSLRS